MNLWVGETSKNMAKASWPQTSPQYGNLQLQHDRIRPLFTLALGWGRCRRKRDVSKVLKHNVRKLELIRLKSIWKKTKA